MTHTMSEPAAWGEDPVTDQREEQLANLQAERDLLLEIIAQIIGGCDQVQLTIRPIKGTRVTVSKINDGQVLVTKMDV